MAQGIVRGFVEVELDKTRHLWFNMAAMKAIKEKGFKLSKLDTVLTDAEGEINWDNIAFLVAAGLQHEDTDITSEWVMENIGAAEIPDLMQKLVQALGMSLPNGEQGTVAPEKTVKPKR